MIAIIYDYGHSGRDIQAVMEVPKDFRRKGVLEKFYKEYLKDLHDKKSKTFIKFLEGFGFKHVDKYIVF